MSRHLILELSEDFKSQSEKASRLYYPTLFKIIRQRSLSLTKLVTLKSVKVFVASYIVDPKFYARFMGHLLQA